jgi:hypothetical protein
MYAALVEVSVAGVHREAGIAGLRNHLVPASDMIDPVTGFIGDDWTSGT